MNILKKILSIVTLSFFIFISIAPVWALTYNDTNYNYEDILLKEIINYKFSLKKIKSGDQYIESIDNIITKIKTNKDKLDDIQTKVYELKIKFSKLEQTTKVQNYILIIDYLSAKINLEIYKIKKEEDTLAIQEKNNELIELEQKIENMKNSNLSESDNKLVNDKLVKIQLNLLEKTSTNLDFVIKEFEKISSYEQKWDFSLNYNIDHDLFWKFTTELNLSNYVGKSSNFDSQFTWELEALINTIPKWWDEIKLQLTSFIDFISKDGNMYLLIDKLNITDEEWIDYIKQQIDILKDIAEQSKYIKFENQDTKLIIENLKNLNPNKIIADSKEFLWESMFKAYKKEWNKYFLIPSKYACDKYKELSVKFDPFNGSECSDSQYESMLEELAEIWDLYIEIGTKSKLWFNIYPEYDVKSFNSYIIFTDTSIEEVNSELIATKDSEWFKLDYIKNNKLDFILNVWKDANINLNSKLDNNNNFSFIDFSYNAESYRDTLKANLKLENKRLNWNFEIVSQKYNWYNYESGESEYVIWNVIIWIIEWEQDYKNQLKKLKINISGIDEDTNEQFLKAELSKEYSNYNLLLEISNNDSPVFDLNVSLNSGKILGNTIIFDRNWEEYLKITHSWEYYTDFFELNNNIEFSENPLNIYTWQINKARDSIRISDLKMLSSVVEQYYQDMWEYPTNIIWNKDIEQYLWKMPTDPSWNIEINWCKFWYIYEVWDDNWIENQIYRFSACVEDTNKALNDKWDDNNRYELWYNKNNFKSREYINNHTNWIKKEIEKEEQESIKANLNIKIDTKRNKNNFNFYLDYIEWDKKVIDIEIDNTWTIEYKDVEINTPTNTIELNEAIWINTLY